MITYVVGLGESDELLDGKRVAWVLIRMHIEGLFAILFLDVFNSGIVVDSNDFKGVKTLEGLH